jgi:hypothetical protein
VAEHTAEIGLEIPPTLTTRVEATKAAADNGYRLIRESRHVDYLFHRLFSLIRMILQANGIAI